MPLNACATHLRCWCTPIHSMCILYIKSEDDFLRDCTPEIYIIVQNYGKVIDIMVHCQVILKIEFCVCVCVCVYVCVLEYYTIYIFQI